MLVAAAGRPYTLDNATVERVAIVFGDTAAGLWLYDEQLRRWSDRPLTPGQRVEVERLGAQVARLRDVVGDVLALAEGIKKETIETLATTGDVDVGLEWLLRSPDG